SHPGSVWAARHGSAPHVWRRPERLLLEHPPALPRDLPALRGGRGHPPPPGHQDHRATAVEAHRRGVRGGRAPHRVLRVLRRLSKRRVVPGAVAAMRRSWAAVLTGAGGAAVVCAVGGWLVSAAGGPPLSRPTSLAADQVTVDNRGTTLVATGHVVVTYRTL